MFALWLFLRVFLTLKTTYFLNIWKTMFFPFKKYLWNITELSEAIRNTTFILNFFTKIYFTRMHKQLFFSIYKQLQFLSQVKVILFNNFVWR